MKQVTLSTGITPLVKYTELYRRMMYGISGHSILVKRNNANKHIVILCDEIQKEFGYKIPFWESVKAIAVNSNK